MARKPQSTTPVGELPNVIAYDGAHAPIILCDACASHGLQDGTIILTLAAFRLLPTSGDKPARSAVIAAHLRCTIEGARSLRDSIIAALLMAEPPPSTPRH